MNTIVCEKDFAKVCPLSKRQNVTYLACTVGGPPTFFADTPLWNALRVSSLRDMSAFVTVFQELQGKCVTEDAE